MSRKDMFCDICINVAEKKVVVKALIDSGNFLKEPISGSPVIVVEKYKLIDIVPKEILQNLKQIVEGKFLGNNEDSEVVSFLPRFRVIPFSSLGKQNGLLLGIKVDSIIIYFEEEEKVINEIIIGIYDEHLSKKENYTALVGLDLLERRRADEYTTNIKV